MKLVEMPIEPKMATSILNSSIIIIVIYIYVDRDEWRVTEEILSIASLLSV
jgi:hypothetical protein